MVMYDYLRRVCSGWRKNDTFRSKCGSAVRRAPDEPDEVGRPKPGYALKNDSIAGTEIFRPCNVIQSAGALKTFADLAGQLQVSQPPSVGRQTPLIYLASSEQR